MKRQIAKRYWPLDRRFFHYVSPEPTSGCWLWDGPHNGIGYGMVYSGGQGRLATHISLILHGRLIPAGKCALHKCDTPACVNPDHLWVGTKRENTLDMHRKGRAGRLGAPGDSNGNARLSPDSVRQIRMLCASGLPHAVVGAQFGVARKTVNGIAARRAWRHVE
jgi:hypothetical protein